MSLTSQNSKAYLLLEDGTVFEGNSFGYIGTSGGEICFTTGMTGYQEVFTDPSYTGQMLIMNTCYVGNYGVNKTDVESDSVKINGLICRNIADRYSRIMATDSLENYLVENKIVAVSGLDTRAIVQHIRENGAMNCILSSATNDIEALQLQLKDIPGMKGLELSSKVSTPQSYEVGNPESSLRISVLDLGIKRNILTCFLERGAFVKVFNAHASFEDLMSFNPDGIFISNGPGDPASMEYAVKVIEQVLHKEIPLFGICLGHQLLAKAMGVSTFKMPYGHRGTNHPVKNLKTGLSEITTQNHGFGIDPDEVVALKNEITITHINLNDDSIEGIRLNNKPAFSVQYHPESTPGAFDSRYLFDDFIELIRTNQTQKI